jgi:opacity protein-like surface antigen
MRLNKLAVALLLSTLINTPAIAAINANPGFYVGGDIATVVYDRPKGAAFDFFDNGVDGVLRPYIGYRFTDYIALELGYNDITNQNNSVSGGSGMFTFGPDHYRLYNIDLAGKLIMPFESGFSVFGKAGLAYTHQDVYNQTFVGSTPSVDTESNQVQPLVGVGVSYNFTKNFASDFSYTYYAPAGLVGRMNMLALGLSYTFGHSSE